MSECFRLVIGAAVPSFAPWIFAILALVTGVIQILGLLAVYNVGYLLKISTDIDYASGKDNFI
jgi:hypothetical protein